MILTIFLTVFYSKFSGRSVNFSSLKFLIQTVAQNTTLSIQIISSFLRHLVKDWKIFIFSVLLVTCVPCSWPLEIWLASPMIRWTSTICKRAEHTSLFSFHFWGEGVGTPMNKAINIFSSIPLEAECKPQYAFIWKGVQYLQLTRGRRSALVFIIDWQKTYWNRQSLATLPVCIRIHPVGQGNKRTVWRNKSFQKLVWPIKKQGQRTCAKDPVTGNKMAVGMYTSKQICSESSSCSRALVPVQTGPGERCEVNTGARKYGLK